LYIRKRIPYRDDPHLINLASNIFNINPEIAHNVLKNSNEGLVLCDKNEEVVGFISYRYIFRDVVFINYALLKQEYQGKGISSSFLPTIISYARNKGIKGVYGLVNRDNHKGLQVFKHWGFTPLIIFPDVILIGAII
jgi:RimJ/RimL family protein N-acetyltransferase